MSPNLAFVTYETPFAPSGGIAAVMSRLPRYVAAASGLDTFVITPFHHRILRTSSVKRDMTSIGKVIVPFDGREMGVNVLLYDSSGRWCFLEAEDDDFFSGARHPYDVSAKGGDLSIKLLEDALFFGCAVAKTLPLLGPQNSWILMLQDWEAATTALALVAESKKKIRSFLTIHNSYDSGVSNSDLLRFGIDPRLCPGNTILDRALLLVEEPVFTVSDQFARDFTEEVLLANVFAPHLQKRLANRLLGANNGVFTDLSVDPDVLARAKRGDFEPFRQWKAANRAQTLKALEDFEPSPDRPIWGDLRNFSHGDVPWFVLAGRDDPRQKGYDVACLAIADFLSSGREANFLFFPIPGDEGLPGLTFLKRLAERFPRNVLVLPFIFQEGYFSALQGATYGIMPSYYEPFGMANEFYLKGTVGIGRATGGIIQQIVPLRSASAFSNAVQKRTDQYFGISARPTGLLYRERDDLTSAAVDWLAINSADYDKEGKNPDRVDQRSGLPLFRSMAGELRLALEDGVRVYRQQPDLYYEMLTEGIIYIQNTFSWERTAQIYLRQIME
jgi:glycogen synthase